MGLIRAAVVVVEDGAGVSDAVPPSWLVLIVESSTGFVGDFLDEAKA